MLVEDITLRIQPLDPKDSIAKAAEAIRLSPTSAVPVATAGRIVGVLSSRDLAAVLDVLSAAELKESRVAEVMRQELVCLRCGTGVEEALSFFRANEIDSAPVLEGSGRYIGMVGTGELVSAVCGGLRPTMIGGLATPLGVYLTNGVVRAGVGDVALVSAGFFMGSLQLFAAWAAYTLTPLLVRTAEEWRGSSLLTGGMEWIPSPMLIAFWLPPALTVVLFSVLFRLSWVTGFHAAEHQVVHAIEQGDDLTVEAVRRQPRVHPRCGTNLMAAFILFMVLHGGLPAELSWLGFPVALIAWRGFGAFLQQYITTKPANERQLRNGIDAGAQLLQRYQLTVTEHPSRMRRLWNMGLLQVLGGFMLLWCLLWALESVSFMNTPWLDFLGK